MKKSTTACTNPSKLALPEWTRPDLTVQALRRGIKPGTLNELGHLWHATLKTSAMVGMQPSDAEQTSFDTFVRLILTAYTEQNSKAIDFHAQAADTYSDLMDRLAEAGNGGGQ